MKVNLFDFDLDLLYDDDSGTEKIESFIGKTLASLVKADAKAQGRSVSNMVALIVRDFYVQKVEGARRLNRATQEVSEIPTFGPELRREDAKGEKRSPGE